MSISGSESGLECEAGEKRMGVGLCQGKAEARRQGYDHDRMHPTRFRPCSTSPSHVRHDGRCNGLSGAGTHRTRPGVATCAGMVRARNSDQPRTGRHHLRHQPPLARPPVGCCHCFTWQRLESSVLQGFIGWLVGTFFSTGGIASAIFRASGLSSTRSTILRHASRL